MQRLVIFSFALLAIIAFFFGLNLGKEIQKVDTPVKVKTAITRIIVTKMVTPTLTPTLKPLPTNPL